MSYGYEEDDDANDLHFKFELLNSEDLKTVTLTCYADREMTPDEYAEALKEYARHIETLMNMNEISNGSVN